MLIRTERAAYAERSYDGYYPSAHLTFNATENFLIRVAYAETFGRPNLNNIIPNTTIDEDDNPNPPPGTPPGRITVVNSGLKPYAARNYDVSLEYYFPKGGLVSIGGFRKDLTDFFGSLNTIATPEILNSLGLDSRYVDWIISTRINVGDARVSGFEFNFIQPLTFIPRWGRHFNFTASGAILHLQGAEGASFERFIPKSGNLGLTFSRQPIVIMAKVNYRGLQRLVREESTAPNAWSYIAPRASLDVNAEYQVSRRLAIFANARNLLNTQSDTERYSPATPGYSHLLNRENYGVQIAVGVRGTF